MLRDQRNPSTPEGLQRLGVLKLESTSSNGGRLLTQAGSLEVWFYAPGIIRLRLERSRETDYGLLVSPPEPMDVNVSDEGDAGEANRNTVSRHLMVSERVHMAGRPKPRPVQEKTASRIDELLEHWTGRLPAS